MADRVIVMAKDPGRILSEIRVSIRYPRQRKDTAFQAIVDTVYAAVAGRTQVEPLVLRGHLGKKLPSASLNALAGLIEQLSKEGDHANLPHRSSELMLELDDVLPIVEAGELLGFLTLKDGTLFLTPLGQAYASASILARKELIASRILRVPAINWVYETLQQDDNRRVDRDYFLDKLRPNFGDLAEKELETAISWGRHAELFAYDSDSDELFLES